jgi:hypothetical protein
MENDGTVNLDGSFSEKIHINSIGYRGRAVFAVKDIKPGEILIRESPLACVPLESSPSATISLKFGKYASSPIEGNLLQYVSSKGFQGVGRTSILAARCLIKIAYSPHLRSWWDALVFHEPSSSKRNENVIASAEILQRLLTSSAPRLATRFTLNDLRIALLKLAANSFTVTTEDLCECGHALYLKTSAINHSCEPNSLQWFDSDGNVVIRSLKNIQRGEEITISYLDLSRPTWWRKAELLSYGFLCICSRCSMSESAEGYRCTSSSCKGLISYKERSNTKYLFKLWLRGEVPQLPSMEESEQAADALPLSLPLGHILYKYDRSETQSVIHCSLYCSECKTTVSMSEYLKMKLTRFQQLYQSARDKLTDGLATDGRQAISAFTAATIIVQQAGQILPVNHSSFLECQSMLLTTYEKLFQIHIKPPKYSSWLSLFVEYLQVSSQYHQNNHHLFPCIHPVPLLGEIKHNEICIEAIQNLILPDIGSSTLTKVSGIEGSVRLILSKFRYYIGQYSKMKMQLSICLGSSHSHISRLDRINTSFISLGYQLSALINR